MTSERIRRHIAGLFGVAVLGLIATVTPSLAGVATDVRAGVTDADQVAVGAGVLAQVGSGSRWFFNRTSRSRSAITGTRSR
jgi:hypothetical protein